MEVYTLHRRMRKESVIIYQPLFSFKFYIMKTILLSIGLLALCFAGIAIKIILKKDGEFSGTCASNNPLLNKEGESCSFCGAAPDEKCKKPIEQSIA